MFLIGRRGCVDTITKESLNMNDPVGSITQTQAAVPVADVRAKEPEPRPQPVPSETVQLSSAAQAALHEMLESPAQTAREAGTGDLQAKRLLLKEQAAKAASAKDEGASSKHVVA